ncbi:MAG: hypothetical protein V1875_00485 [Candidatus Altiarchaeota archaeon]
MNLKILNSREKKKIAEKLSREYGGEDKMFGQHVLLQSGGDIWIVSRDCVELDLSRLKVDSLGLQVLRKWQPTIHGIQLLLKKSQMQELDKKEAMEFIKGKAVKKSGRIMSYRGKPIDAAEAVTGGYRRKKTNS